MSYCTTIKMLILSKAQPLFKDHNVTLLKTFRKWILHIWVVGSGIATDELILGTMGSCNSDRWGTIYRPWMCFQLPHNHTMGADMLMVAFYSSLEIALSVRAIIWLGPSWPWPSNLESEGRVGQQHRISRTLTESSSDPQSARCGDFYKG
jgi:hypothetical protein